MDKGIKYIKTTHDVCHYFNVDGIRVRWNKTWDGYGEIQHVQICDISGFWSRLDEVKAEGYIERFKLILEGAGE